MENGLDWLTAPEAVKKVIKDRLDTDLTKLCTFGIKPLDDSLVALAKGELLVIGADSGAGKTEIALHIARHNAKRGKCVAVYHLEGGYAEATQRILWKEICDIYYKDYYQLGLEMDYRNWVLNYNQDPIMLEIENKAYENIKTQYAENLYFFNCPNGMNIDQFTSSLYDFRNLESILIGNEHLKKYELDLIVIDHLQYFSLEHSESEITEITKILRSVKELSQYSKIPIILVSHLRKKAKDRGLPDQEDFYGSSNIPKIATTAIILSSAREKENLAKNIFPTFIRIVKSRTGIRPNYAMLVNFDQVQREYCEGYVIHRVNSFNQVSTEPLKQEELPKWAKKL